MPLSDANKLLDNAAGPVTFRTTEPFARLAVDGNAFDAGTTFTESQTITSPGLYQLTLDAPGYATVQEPGGPE